MTDQRPDFGIEQQVFGAALDLDETLPGQADIEVLGDRPAQAPVAHDHPIDALAFQVRRNTAPGGLDFW
ncbi:hypothetical protein D3C73_1468450 [compost metagenome]